MYTLHYDLHLHSCLSPCGDMDMTPGNIVGMAAVKGLDLIALTDHNTCRNCPPFLKWAGQFGILALPGMEINTSEEVHAVCLFPALDQAMAFDAYVYERLVKIENRPAIFGEQQLCDENDGPAGIEPCLLINRTEISFDGLWELTESFGGAMFPAHIDKPANSLLSNLGFVPPDSRFRAAELADLKKLHEIRRQNPYLENCRILCDSDAHYLEHIHEPEHVLALPERSPEAVIAWLRGE